VPWQILSYSSSLPFRRICPTLLQVPALSWLTVTPMRELTFFCLHDAQRHAALRVTKQPQRPTQSPQPNWLRFARKGGLETRNPPLPRPVSGAVIKLGSFRTLAPNLEPHTYRSPDIPPYPRLALFCALAPSPEPHACYYPYTPASLSLALFCRFILRPGTNWVRFARFTPRPSHLLP
jgi:hypothetical protein